jgi:hypothetical protein
MSKVHDDAIGVDLDQPVGKPVEGGSRRREPADTEAARIERLRQMPTWSNHVVLHPLISRSE